MIDGFCSAEHYHAHLQPIWDALSPEERGTFYVLGRTLTHLYDKPGYTVGRPDPKVNRPVMVASYGDLQAAWQRPIVYLEHGVGQQYPRSNPAYAGGPGRERVVLMLCPNDHTTEANQAAHPDIPSVTIGTPWLDKHTPRERTGRTVAFSWHWRNRMWPASDSAFDHYKSGLRDAVGELRSDGWEVIGTAHPRAWHKPPAVAATYEALGVEMVHDLAEVVERADVLCADNTSAMPLSAALGVRQVVLDCPAYGVGYTEALWPRFALDLGVVAREASEIPVAVEASYVPDVSEVVPYTDGRCAARAVEALRRYML